MAAGVRPAHVLRLCRGHGCSFSSPGQLCIQQLSGPALSLNRDDSWLNFRAAGLVQVLGGLGFGEMPEEARGKCRGVLPSKLKAVGSGW